MRRFTHCFHLLLSSSACLCLAIFLAGRVLTDRFLVTQYLYWIPSFVLIGVAGVLGVGAWAVGRVRRRSSPVGRTGVRAPRSLTRPLTRIGLLGSLTGAVFILGYEWRLWAAVLPGPASGTPVLHFAHWNMTFVPHEQWPRYIAAVPREPATPDVLLISNPTWSSDLGLLAQSLGAGYTCKRVGTFAVASRFPVLKAGWASLNIPPLDEETARLSAPFYNPKGGDDEFLPSWSPIPRVGGTGGDPGAAMFAIIDATPLFGRPIVIWGLDFPSDVRRWRYGQARDAATRLADLERPAGEGEPARAPFPAPDLVAGDFNTPRGSASLGIVARGFPHAFRQGGYGYAASWPRRQPLVHIDHTFIGPSFRAVRYRLVNPGIAEHMVQVVDVVGKQ